MRAEPRAPRRQRAPRQRCARTLAVRCIRSRVRGDPRYAAARCRRCRSFCRHVATLCAEASAQRYARRPCRDVAAYFDAMFFPPLPPRAAADFVHAMHAAAPAPPIRCMPLAPVLSAICAPLPLLICTPAHDVWRRCRSARDVTPALCAARGARPPVLCSCLMRQR